MQQTLALFDEIPAVETLLAKREDQWFDRKSFKTDATKLADWLVGFANADGSRIAVGILDGQIEGVDSRPDHLNELMQAAIDFTEPAVRTVVTLLDCVNSDGAPDHVLLLDIEASEGIHRNRKQECFLRVGDENRRLSQTEERQLVFDKGEAVYDKTIAQDIGLSDLDMTKIEEYARHCNIIDVMALMRTRGLYFDNPYRKGVTQAGLLLFGKETPIWSYVRYMRYDGVTAETGVRSNLIKDVRLEGPISQIIDQAKELLSKELEVIRQTASGRFEPVLTLPEFAWLEAVVNAVTHRSYSLHGDGIRVKQFTDRLEVESPGRLPGLVRVQNIRHSRFARNPHIARVLAETTNYVRESNEGVQRMFEEMEQSGLRPPNYNVTDSSVRVTLYKNAVETRTIIDLSNLRTALGSRSNEARVSRLVDLLQTRKSFSTHDFAKGLGVHILTARSYLQRLEKIGIVTRNAKSLNDPKSLWIVAELPPDIKED